MIWSQLSHIQRMKLQIELVIQFLRFAMVVSYMTNLFCLHSAHMSHIYIYTYAVGCSGSPRSKYGSNAKKPKNVASLQRNANVHILAFVTKTFAGPFFLICALATLFML